MLTFKKVVKYIAIIILVLFLLAPIIRYIADEIYQRPRSIETISTNIFDADFERQLTAIIEAIGKREDLQNTKVKTLHVEYDMNGNIKEFLLDLIARDNDRIRMNRITLNEFDRYTYMQAKLDYYDGYEETIPYNMMLEVINDIDILELSPNKNYSNYGFRFLSRNEVSSKNKNLYILDDKRAVEYSGESNIEGYLLEKYALNKESTSVVNHYYFFDAKIDINSSELSDQKDDNGILENQDPEMVNVYNTLMSNMKILNTDKTLGITLLDLDFDTIPEVLVTRLSQNSEIVDDTTENEVADVDVYRIENENLIYIDTLYNYHKIVYELGNVLGLKTLEDGSKAWFNMSYINRDTGKVSDTDYLFTLEGSKLKFQEVFSRDNNGNYYYYGELMKINEEPFHDENFGDMIMYSWGDYKSAFGTWELIGRIKQDFCEDLKENSYNLYSSWLSHTSAYEKSYKLPLSERLLSYNIAYLVDSFYLGSYDANKQYFDYRFLGDYAKPAIYLYPTKETDVSVKINFNGTLTCTYPEYEKGWSVTAYPDGKLINKKDGREYSYLFWEGKGVAEWDFSKGFVVKGSDTVSFLQEKLQYMGLNNQEINDFIVYWLPLMKHNKYNLIAFQKTSYEDNVKLNISPKPDSILRVFMAYKAIDKYIEIPEQRLSTFNRNGFAVVEWGGTEVK